MDEPFVLGVFQPIRIAVEYFEIHYFVTEIRLGFFVTEDTVALRQADLKLQWCRCLLYIYFEEHQGVRIDLKELLFSYIQNGVLLLRLTDNRLECVLHRLVLFHCFVEQNAALRLFGGRNFTTCGDHWSLAYSNTDRGARKFHYLAVDRLSAVRDLRGLAFWVFMG